MKFHANQCLTTLVDTQSGAFLDIPVQASLSGMPALVERATLAVQLSQPMVD